MKPSPVAANTIRLVGQSIRNLSPEEYIEKTNIYQQRPQSPS